MASEVLTYVNQLRSSLGLGQLTWDDSLTASADVRAQEIVTSFSHTRPDGSSCFTAFPGDRYSYGENIAAGQTSASQVYNDWYNSPGHYANMVNNSFNRIGISCYKVPGSTYQYYWVQCFSD